MSDSLKDGIARALRRQRADRMWSQEKLAEMSGLSRGYVQRAESSNAEISLAAFHAIAQAFGMKGSDLLREVEDAAPPPKPVTSTKSKKGSR